jgi:hypothetical protein
MKKSILLGLTVVLMLSFAGAAMAVPKLQTYIVGSGYHTSYNWLDRYSWVTNNQEFDLKIVASWGTGAMPAYDYMNIYAAIAVPFWQSGSVWINGVEITAFQSYYSALPSGVTPSWYLPISLPNLLGKYNFQGVGTIDNDQMGAMNYDHGSITGPAWGDEILLDVVVRGFDWTHFDAVGVNSQGRTFTNYPDNDASYFATPEPGTLGLLGIGLLGIVPLLKRRNS